MTRGSFDKAALLYNFVEKHILDDFSSTCSLMNDYLVLNQHETIIDVGGGTGLIAKALRKKTQNSDIVVIDLSRKMLQKVDNPTLSIIQGDATSFPLKSDTCTLAIMINAIHHIDKNKQYRALCEVFRILKKQGRIFIIDLWVPNTFVSNLFIKIEEFLVGNTAHLDPSGMKQALTDAGFHEVELLFSTKNQYQYVTLAKK